MKPSAWWLALAIVPWVIVCVLPLAVAAQQPDPIDQGLDHITVDIEELAAELQKILDEDGIPG